MVLADCHSEEGMLIVCDEIEELLNQLAAEIVRHLQQNARATPPLSEDVIMKQLAAHPEVFLFYCFLYIHINANNCKLN